MIDFELLSSALTIVHGNDIYKPIIRRRPDGIFAEYCIGGVNIAVMISMFDLREGRMSLEEYTRLARKRALFEYMNFVENERDKEWSNAYEFLKQLACESGDDEFCIGELHKGAVLKLKQVEWYKWNEDKGEWVEYDHR